MKKRFGAVPTIIILNLFVFLFWHSNGVEEPLFLTRNFTVSWTLLSQGRIWTLLTSEFSHYSFLHFFLNMYVFYGFGSFIEGVLGSSRFIYFYLFAAAISSLAHSMVSAFLMHQPDLPALGASGAISGVVMLFALLFPKQKIFLFGFIGMPALIGALAFVGLDLWGLVAQVEGGGLPIGHGAHLGGTLTGALYYFFFLRKLRMREN